MRHALAGRRAASGPGHPGQPAAAVQHRQPRAEPGGDPLVHAPFLTVLVGRPGSFSRSPCLPDTKGQGLDRVPVQPELEGSLPLSPVDLRALCTVQPASSAVPGSGRGTCPSGGAGGTDRVRIRRPYARWR